MHSEQIMLRNENSNIERKSTPVYYFGMTAQLKAVIDRLYSTFTISNQLRGKKSVLLVSQGQAGMWAALPTIGCYEEIIRLQGWEDAGQVIAKGIVEPRCN